jgi:Cu/Ag efflux protein CusF
MDIQRFGHWLVFLAVMALTALAGCSSPGPVGVEQTEAIETPDGAILVDTFTATATISDIDSARRRVTLLLTNGDKHTYTCGPEVVNFGQLQVGDSVTVKLTEGAAVFIGHGAPPSAAAGSAVALAPIGAKPGAVMVETMQITARVLDVDPNSRRVTLQLPDLSTRKVRVGKQVDLTNVAPGDDATVQVSEGVAITVEKK